MAKYLDPKADVTFKKVFGEHKNLVISLLNALLPLDEGKQVESIEYLPPEMPQELLENAEVSEALEIVEESAYSAEEMAAYEGYWDAVRREATIIGELNDAREELAEERKKRDATVEKLRQSARQMKADGMAVETIAKYTGLTADEIARL